MKTWNFGSEKWRRNSVSGSVPMRSLQKRMLRVQASRATTVAFSEAQARRILRRVWQREAFGEMTPETLDVQVRMAMDSYFELLTEGHRPTDAAGMTEALLQVIHATPRDELLAIVAEERARDALGSAPVAAEQEHQAMPERRVLLRRTRAD